MAEGTIYGSDLAYIHHVGYGRFAAAVAPAIGQMLGAAGIREGLVVDLGCGSGILAGELTALGYDVLGVDRSPHMIARARRVAPRARFVHGSIHTVALPPCDAVVAVGESLSYLTSGARRPPGLGRLFRRVARALRPGGLFVFDVIAAGRPLMAYCSWQLGPDWAVLADVRENAAARVVTRAITTFRRRRGGYRRADESHAVGVYDRVDVARQLRAAGLTASVRRGYGSVALPRRRLAFVARRPRRWSRRRSIRRSKEHA